MTDELVKRLERLSAQVDALRAERDRLHEALTDAGAYLDRGLDKMAFNIIRAALKGESHE